MLKSYGAMNYTELVVTVKPLHCSVQFSPDFGLSKM